MKIKITKLEELPDALHPNNIPVGYEKIVEVDEKSFREPEIGARFTIIDIKDIGRGFSTSGVQEILDKNTFRTFSSIYRWEIVE